MAKMKGPVQFTGTLGNISVYELEGVDGLVGRQKGGPTRNALKNSPAYAGTRKNNLEFTPVNDVVEDVKNTFGLINCLRDYNYSPFLGGLCLNMQKLDTEHPHGKRDYLFSRYGHLLEGFSLNKKHYFSGIIRPSVNCTIDRSTGTAEVDIPMLKPGVNLFLPWQLPLYRFVITIGAVSDYICTEDAYKRGSINNCFPGREVETEWFYTTDKFKARSLPVQLHPKEVLDEHKTIIVSVAIQSGSGCAKDNLTAGGRLRTACAKILKTG